MAPPGWAGRGAQGERHQTAPRYPAAVASVARVLCWPLSEAVFGTEPLALWEEWGWMGRRSWGSRQKCVPCLQPIGGFVRKPYPPERQVLPTVLKHAPDSLSCPVREKNINWGTMTTTSKHLYPFIQHSVNVYCEPDITSCVPAVPDVTVIHTRMFLECCFSALVISGVPLISRRELLGQNGVQAPQTWHTHGRPRLAPAALPLFTSLFMLQLHTSGFCLLHLSPPPALILLAR